MAPSLILGLTTSLRVVDRGEFCLRQNSKPLKYHFLTDFMRAVLIYGDE